MYSPDLVLQNEASCWNIGGGSAKSLQKEMSQLLGINTDRFSFEYYRVAEKLLFLRCNWLEHESDHKPLQKLELTSGAIILSLYLSVLCI